MIFKRILMGLIVAATLASASAVLVVALAFTLYALVEPRLGRAGAAATVAGTTAGLMAVAGLALALAGRRKAPKTPPTLLSGLIETVVSFLKEKPIVSASAAVGAGLMAIRNPKYLGALIRAILDGKSTPT